MRFVITGGAGFIGSHLAERILADGHEVVVLDDFSTGKLENLAPFRNRLELIEGSVTDLSACRQAVCDADYVLHEAALPSVPRSIRDPGATHEACTTGTLNVLLASRDAGVRRVVYAGSSSAYGNTPMLPKVESMIPRPRSPYAVAKLTGEYYCQSFYTTYGLETVVLRYFNIFGPRQDPNSQYGAVIPKLISAAIAGMRPEIFGDGEQTRDFTHVTNAVHANLLACKAGPEAVGQVFNVGCGERISVNLLWQNIQALTQSDLEPRYAPERPGDVRDSLAGLERASTVLGYSPAVSLHEGLRGTVKAFMGRSDSHDQSTPAAAATDRAGTSHVSGKHID